MSVHRALLRSENPRRKQPVTCSKCGTTTYVTKSGLWYRHRQPPAENSGLTYDVYVPKGPICKASGTKRRSNDDE